MPSPLQWHTLLAVLAIGHAELRPRFERYGCQKGHDTYPFCNVSLTVEERVKDLISRLTLDEKPGFLEARWSPKGNVSRLGIPQYDWGGNCVHGVQSRCGTGSKNDTRCPTAFPNPNLLGASFNATVWRGMGSVIGKELRSLWRQGVGENHDDDLPPIGLDCWSPNINVVRDPRWGRNVETPSEDPFLLGQFGVAVTKGLQEGEDPRYLQAVVTLKHFVANSLEGNWPGPGGPKKYPGRGPCPGGVCTRHTMDVNISDYDLASTYMAAFRASVVEGGALGVMCSYNAVNGAPSCANEWLLGQKLRGDWSFKGYVTSDTTAVQDIAVSHFYVPSEDEAVVKALGAGTDVDSGGGRGGQPYIKYIPSLVQSGKLSEAVLDEALKNTLTLRFRLGLFDPPDDQPYEHVPGDVVQSSPHVQAAIEATEQGLVLLENKVVGPDGRRALPITSGKVAVVGPHATDRKVLLGNYLGQSCSDGSANCVESILEALGNRTEVSYAPGLHSITGGGTDLIPEAVKVAKAADHVVLVLGLSSTIEREGVDRHSTTFPKGQLELFSALNATGKPVTVILLNGGTISMSGVKASAAAIIEAWYPGFYGAAAVARAVVGHTNRWGKLPVTVYDESFDSTFDMLDFDMTKAPGRTYRYFTGQPLWPFGHGLSYTHFGLKLLSDAEAVLKQQGGQSGLRVEVQNLGTMDGDEVVMAFFTPLNRTLPAGSKASLLQKQLFAFRRVSLPSGARAVVELGLEAESLAVHADNGDKVLWAGSYEVLLSTGSEELSVKVVVEGESEHQPLVLEKWGGAGQRPPMQGFAEGQGALQQAAPLIDFV